MPELCLMTCKFYLASAAEIRSMNIEVSVQFSKLNLVMRGKSKIWKYYFPLRSI